MILCRLFVGGVSVEGETFSTFRKQGEHQTVYVIDELAIKSYTKHKNITGGGENQVPLEKISEGEFRDIEGYDIVAFFDKFVRPVILQEHFGMRTVFSQDEKFLQDFADKYVVAVNVPDDSRSIPVGSTGILMPKPYRPGQRPSVANYTESVVDREE